MQIISTKISSIIKMNLTYLNIGRYVAWTFQIGFNVGQAKLKYYLISAY